MNRIALNFELPSAQAGATTPPDWLLLIPAGHIRGIDGRTWVNDQPDVVVANNRALERDVVFDIEHASELKAPKGEPAPAIAWIDQLEVREGAIWGHVAWNSEGAGLIASRAYRYYSPAFIYDANNRIHRLASVGLTNKQNLSELPALNRQSTETEDAMSLSEAIRQALSLAATANEADAVLAIGNLKSQYQTALNSAQQPPLEKFVPRADFDALQTKHDQLQTALNSEKSNQRETEITALVDGAIAEGKVTPATRDFYLATCRQEGGVEQFKTFLAKAPKIAVDTNLDQRKPGEGDQLALNAEQQKIAGMFGNCAEDIAKFGK